jgi:hypothetical protein
LIDIKENLNGLNFFNKSSIVAMAAMAFQGGRYFSFKVLYYMASITSGEMADCDWLSSTFSGPLFPRNGRENC